MLMVEGVVLDCTSDIPDPCRQLNNRDTCDLCLRIDSSFPCGFCLDEQMCLLGNSSGPYTCSCNLWLFERTNQSAIDKLCAEDLCLSNNCADCTAKSYCVWCEAEQLCLSGGMFGPFTTNHNCGDYRWWHCGGKPGSLLVIIVSSSLGGLILICVFIKIMYNVFCSKNNDDNYQPLSKDDL